MTLDAQILKALRNVADGGISEAELAQKLGISRPALSARVQQLRSLGYDIESSPHLGYRLLSGPDALHSEDLVARLGRTKIIGRDIRVFQETDSTNDLVDKLGRDGLKEGVVVFAESQTRGRGRLGRSWVSPAGKGLWLSILLRPGLPPVQITRLTVVGATAVRRAIQMQTGLPAKIKWPNDIVIGERKIAGILTELSAEIDRVKYVVLGIGVDVNLGAEDFPEALQKMATSLKLELGESVGRAELAVRILRELDNDYAQMTGGNFMNLAEEWEEHCTTLGHDVCIRAGERKISGRAESLGEDGALLLRTEHGHIERIVGGDVALLKGSAP